MTGRRDKFGNLDEDERRLIAPFLVGNPTQSGEWRAYCPRCETPGESGSPSASFNFNRNIWKCFHCERGGTVIRLVRQMLKEESGPAPVIDIKTRKPVLPTEQNLINWHKVLRAPANIGAFRLLRDRRGLTVETMQRFKIGYSTTHKRYTIPVYDRDGKTLLAVKLYRPTAKRPVPKMTFLSEDNNVSLFNARALDENDDIVLCEGEMDCILLAQNGIPAVTHTAGAGAFQPGWAKEFKEKNMYIIPDDDKAGAEGAIRTAKMLSEFAESVYIVHLNTGIKSGDITDYFVRLNHTVHDLRRLVEAADQFSLKEATHEVPVVGRLVSLMESQNPDNNGTPLELIVAVAGKQSPPYLAPKHLLAECDRKKGDRCKICPMFAHEGKRELRPNPDDSTLLRFVNANEIARERVMIDMAGALCNDHIEFDVKSEWALEELVVVQSVGHRSEEAQMPLSRKLFNVGTFQTGVNTTVRVVGRQLADPRDSRGIFHGWQLDPVEVDIDKFTMTEQLRQDLSIFQPRPEQTPLQKCGQIAKDLAANVTHIYGRDALHVAYDLVWHSILAFDFQGKRVSKGWLEAVAIGDTRTGKSETGIALAKHYNAGVVKSCEGATLAGLVGGATQMPQGRGWMVTWGTLPLHDRRLVILDEFSGIKDKDIIEQMSSIRSSGVAQMTKIVSEETSARTRLIWISNDPNGKRMAETDGMDSLQRLITNPEDIARFDFAMALSNADVDSKLINSSKHKRVVHKYKSELCSALVLWAWSRKPEHVKWVSGAEDLVISEAEAMGARYVSTPPLVQVENIRLKLARVAAAIAARTFSTNKTGQLLLIRAEHVSSAVAFLDWVYGSETFGYLRHSRRTLTQRAEAERNKQEVTRYLRRNRAALEALRVVGRDKFRVRDFEEFGALDTPDGDNIDSHTLVQDLLRWRMIRRLVADRGYIVAEPALIEVLKALEDQGL